TWDTGYYGEVTLTNPGTSKVEGWSITILIPKDMDVTDSWGATIDKPDPPEGAPEFALLVSPESPANRVLDGGATVTFGFSVNEAAQESSMILDPARLADPGVAPDPDRRFAPSWRGFNMGSWWQGTFNAPSSLTALEQMTAYGANMVALVPTRYVADISSANIYTDMFTETDENLIAMIRKAKSLGLKVVIKPHVHVKTRDDSNTFGPHQRIEPNDTARWFAEFEDTLVHYAKIAAAEGADAFVLAGELESMTKPKYELPWRKVIAAVRDVYDGPLTYAANWGEELQVPFWDALDYIGVDMYAPIAKTENPTVEEALKGWLEPSWNSVVRARYGDIPLLEAMRRLSLYYDKPVIFTEHGYRAIDGGGMGLMDDAVAPLDFEEQAIMYETFFRALDIVQPDWIAGIWLWDWVAEETGLPGAVPDDMGFSPAGKPAQEVFLRWMGPESDFAKAAAEAANPPNARPTSQTSGGLQLTPGPRIQ
ncbi:MAG: glycoside hydrolase family 113, partial [Rhodospirillaceae bacterium]